MAESKEFITSSDSCLSEGITEELNFLRAVYSRTDELIIQRTSDNEDGNSSLRLMAIQISPEDCSGCKVLFTLCDEYPSKAPKIEVMEDESRQTRLHDESLQSTLQALCQLAQELLGKPMIFTLMERFKELQGLQGETERDEVMVDDILPFQEGYSPESDLEKDTKPQKRKKKGPVAPDSSVVNTKKPPMKTATDVIHRIMWDEDLNQDDFSVGYLDRFVGIIEEPFSLFDWGDLAEADVMALAVPRHRIQYFKYKDIIVWDKTQRLDLMFGSTGSNTSIREIIKKIEKGDSTVEEKEACDSSKNDDETHVDGDVAEDEVDAEKHEGNVKKKIKIKQPKQATHFMAVRVTVPEVIENIKKFQESICETEQILKKACIIAEKLHVTLCVMRLENPEQIEKAGTVLKDLEHDLAGCFSPETILQFNKIVCWQGRVVVSPVEGQGKETLQKGVDIIASRFEEEGIKIKDEKRSFKPHLTAIKLNAAVRRKNKKYKIKEDLIEPHKEMELGSQSVDEISLCSMVDKPREDGFYHTLATVSSSLE